MPESFSSKRSKGRMHATSKYIRRVIIPEGSIFKRSLTKMKVSTSKRTMRTKYLKKGCNYSGEYGSTSVSKGCSLNVSKEVFIFDF